MISLKEVVEKLKIEPISSTSSLDRPIAGGYASDLLSCAMKGQRKVISGSLSSPIRTWWLWRALPGWLASLSPKGIGRMQKPCPRPKSDGGMV